MIVEIILGLFVLIEGYVIWNLFRKTELLETWVETFTRRIQRVQDDEVGTIFKQIKDTTKQLSTLKGE